MQRSMFLGIRSVLSRRFEPDRVEGAQGIVRHAVALVANPAEVVVAAGPRESITGPFAHFTGLGPMDGPRRRQCHAGPAR